MRVIKEDMMKKNAGIIILTFLLSACASSVANLQRETAKSVGNIPPDSVYITSVDRGATSVTWEALTSKGKYNCSADDMVRSVYCLKTGVKN